MSLHDGNHNSVVGMFVGLSWELCCWWQLKWELEQWWPSLRSAPGEHKPLCCCLSLRNARSFHLLWLQVATIIHVKTQVTFLLMLYGTTKSITLMVDFCQGHSVTGSFVTQMQVAFGCDQVWGLLWCVLEWALLVQFSYSFCTTYTYTWLRPVARGGSRGFGRTPL